MVTIDKVKSGAAQWIDRELLPKMSGLSRWVFGALSTGVVLKLDKLAENVRSNPVVSAMGIIDDNNMVDVEMLYQLIMPQAEKCPAEISLPGVGTVRITADDVRNLYTYITQG